MKISNMQKIRDYYGVPAKRGMQIVFNGTRAIITGTDWRSGSMRLRIRTEGSQRSVCVHPTWKITYPA